ncbi:unnamed protein product [Heligmosomoides polygyrus]|uniref:Uncharacterized protein n=1 Tax=Heligmosomoides polygyrus TaxID=6339 RepID=A0A183F3X2_HELPZ|nr:unnamed protein product [Heligmosomoides polygyrus]
MCWIRTKDLDQYTVSGNEESSQFIVPPRPHILCEPLHGGKRTDSMDSQKNTRFNRLPRSEASSRSRSPSPMRLSGWESSDEDEDQKQQAKPVVQLATMAARRSVKAPSSSPSPPPPSPSAKKKAAPTVAARSTPNYKVYAVPGTFCAKCAPNAPLQIIRVPSATDPTARPYAVPTSPTCKDHHITPPEPLPTVHRLPPFRDVPLEVAVYQVRWHGPP